LKLVLPENWAVRCDPPSGSTLVVKLATPSGPSATEPGTPATVKSTLPVGARPGAVVTVAVKVTFCLIVPD